MDEKGAEPGYRHRLPIIAAGFMVVLFLLAYGLINQAPLEGRPAPDLELLGYGGEGLVLRALRGQPVVLNFWASWCDPCRQEAPALAQVHREYEPKGVAFIGINVKDLDQNARAFLNRYGISYPNGPDPYGRISRAYRVTAFPETFVIAPDGTVRKRFIGVVTEEQLKGILDELLREMPTSTS
ncbi:MAG: TlpA family protein disulfide reductase [Chloroflexi bacterium]|nr:TlpA family protein disulfide reductase [Chloroflexota bacterium]